MNTFNQNQLAHRISVSTKLLEPNPITVNGHEIAPLSAFKRHTIACKQLNQQRSEQQARSLLFNTISPRKQSMSKNNGTGASVTMQSSEGNRAVYQQVQQNLPKKLAQSTRQSFLARGKQPLMTLPSPVPDSKKRDSNVGPSLQTVSDVLKRIKQQEEQSAVPSNEVTPPLRILRKNLHDPRKPGVFNALATSPDSHAFKLKKRAVTNNASPLVKRADRQSNLIRSHVPNSNVDWLHLSQMLDDHGSQERQAKSRAALNRAIESHKQIDTTSTAAIEGTPKLSIKMLNHGAVSQALLSMPKGRTGQAVEDEDTMMFTNFVKTSGRSSQVRVGKVAELTPRLSASKQGTQLAKLGGSSFRISRNEHSNMGFDKQTADFKPVNRPQSKESSRKGPEQPRDPSQRQGISKIDIKSSSQAAYLINSGNSNIYRFRIAVPEKNAAPIPKILNPLNVKEPEPAAKPISTPKQQTLQRVNKITFIKTLTTKNKPPNPNPNLKPDGSVATKNQKAKNANSFLLRTSSLLKANQGISVARDLAPVDQTESMQALEGHVTSHGILKTQRQSPQRAKQGQLATSSSQPRVKKSVRLIKKECIDHRQQVQKLMQLQSDAPLIQTLKPEELKLQFKKSIRLKASNLSLSLNRTNSAESLPEGSLPDALAPKQAANLTSKRSQHRPLSGSSSQQQDQRFLRMPTSDNKRNIVYHHYAATQNKQGSAIFRSHDRPHFHNQMNGKCAEPEAEPTIPLLPVHLTDDEDMYSFRERQLSLGDEPLRRGIALSDQTPEDSNTDGLYGRKSRCQFDSVPLEKAHPITYAPSDKHVESMKDLTRSLRRSIVSGGSEEEINHVQNELRDILYFSGDGSSHGGCLSERNQHSSDSHSEGHFSDSDEGDGTGDSNYGLAPQDMTLVDNKFGKEDPKVTSLKNTLMKSKTQRVGLIQEPPKKTNKHLVKKRDPNQIRPTKYDSKLKKNHSPKKGQATSFVSKQKKQLMKSLQSTSKRGRKSPKKAANLNKTILSDEKTN